jgi:prepilin-type N-terminal cleavage/methylation domain
MLKKKGFTLIELIPVILILSLAMISVGIVVNYGLDTNKRQTIQNEVQENVRKAIVDFTDNVRKGTVFFLYGDTTDEQLPDLLSAKMNLDHESNSELFDLTSMDGYRGILLIHQISGQYCLYAIKDHVIHRFTFKPDTSVMSPDTMFQDKDGTKSIIDDYTRAYYHSYLFGTEIDDNNFKFYQGSRYFRCFQEEGKLKIVELKRIPIKLVKIDDSIIAEDIEAVSVMGSDNSYKFGFTISKSNALSGLHTERKIETSVALVNYGGDEDEE